jgi:hypothetical protein
MMAKIARKIIAAANRTKEQIMAVGLRLGFRSLLR